MISPPRSSDHHGSRPPDTATGAVFLAPAEYIDSDHPAIRDRAARLMEGVDNPRRAAQAVYAFVRDLAYEAEDFERLDNYRASRVLATGHGYCVAKAGLFAALCRATGIPARVAFADVRNHLASPRLRLAMGTDVFAWHGYAEVMLGDRWVKVSPTFDKATCLRAGVPPLEFDGEHDALLQSFDGGGHMEYLKFHGAFHDVPARFLAAEMARLYPFTRNGGLQRFKDRTTR
jgi:transglutaminase-like putative cysteine protease